MFYDGSLSNESRPIARPISQLTPISLMLNHLHYKSLTSSTHPLDRVYSARTDRVPAILSSQQEDPARWISTRYHPVTAPILLDRLAERSRIRYNEQ